MKVAICTSDFYYPVQESVKENGHQVTNVYTSCTLDTGFSDKTYEFAQDMRAEFKEEAITEQDIEKLEEKGVELLLSAAYDYKIPIPSDSQIKFINVHGTLLPHGRGPWPQPYLLQEFPEYAGMTLHTMTEKWDFGDVVLQESIDLLESDDVDSLVGKSLILAKKLSDTLLSNFKEVWKKRKPMTGKGSYWNKPTEKDMTLSLLGEVLEVQNIYRAFAQNSKYMSTVTGRLESIKKLQVWKDAHNYQPGTLVTLSPPIEIYALKDGYLSVIPQR